MKQRVSNLKHESLNTYQLIAVAPGNACFLCNDDRDLGDVGGLNTSSCPQCSPTVALDLSQGQRILEHIGAHILNNPGVDWSMELCGLCLHPMPLCQFFLTKGKGAHGSLKINQKLSRGCLMKVKYVAGTAHVMD